MLILSPWLVLKGPSWRCFSWWLSDRCSNFGTYTVIPPEGAKVQITMIYDKPQAQPDLGQTEPESAPAPTTEDQLQLDSPQKVEVPASEWIIDYRSGKTFPKGPWIFGGSALKKDFTDTERYLADLTGSIIGIVTFGDETIGWNEVWPDEQDYNESEWVCNTKVMPPWNTPLTVRIRPWVEEAPREKTSPDDSQTGSNSNKK